jgi:hypothetical protein
MNKSTHWKNVFDSPFLSSWDITEQTPATIKCVKQETHNLGRGDEPFNVAYFVEKEIEPGMKFKPMILNSGNCKILDEITKTHETKDWNNVPVTISTEQRKLKGQPVRGLLLTGRKPSTPCSTKDIEAIEADIKAIGGDVERFCALLKIKGLNHLNSENIGKARQLIAAKKAQVK